MPNVLIVDDEPAMRKLLTRFLTPAGYTLHEADSAEAALRVLGERPIDVVLCDRAMPGKDGDWLINQMRQTYRTVAIVLATADDMVPPKVSLRDGVVGYVVKPFREQVVLDSVSDAVIWARVAATRKNAEPNQQDIDEWLRGRAGRESRQKP